MMMCWNCSRVLVTPIHAPAADGLTEETVVVGCHRCGTRYRITMAIIPGKIITTTTDSDTISSDKSET